MSIFKVNGYELISFINLCLKTETVRSWTKLNNMVEIYLISISINYKKIFHLLLKKEEDVNYRETEYIEL